MSRNTDITLITERLQQRFSGISNVSLFEDGTLQVEVSGQCADCPVRSLTFEQEILEVLGDEFPAVKRVSAGPVVSKEVMDMVHNILRGKK